MSDTVNVNIDELTEETPILDIREKDEWEAGHIEGALHIPLTELPSRLDELDPDTEYRVTCLRGGRSTKATEWLNAQGYSAVNVLGGMDAWGASGRPVVSETEAEPYVKGH